MMCGEARAIEIDWNQVLGELNTTISTSCFESNGGLLGISGAAIADGVTSVLLTACNIGSQVIENCVTLVDGQTIKKAWYVKVTDPLRTWPIIGDYQQ